MAGHPPQYSKRQAPPPPRPPATKKHEVFKEQDYQHVDEHVMKVTRYHFVLFCFFKGEGGGGNNYQNVIMVIMVMIIIIMKLLLTGGDDANHNERP